MMKTHPKRTAKREMKKVCLSENMRCKRKNQNDQPANLISAILHRRSFQNTILLLMIWTGTLPLAAQTDVNYREELVPVYSLPDPLTFERGAKVRHTGDWELRRQELISLFEKEMFGVTPTWKGSVKGTILSEKMACNGKAVRQEILIELSLNKESLKMVLLLYLPKDGTPHPLFLGYNFHGNHTVTAEPDVRITESWVRNSEVTHAVNNRADERGRGSFSGRWPIGKIIEKGFGLATLYYGDIDPDFDDGFRNGVHALYAADGQATWGSVAAWAWGLSRVMDYLENDARIDSGKVAVIGHSRLGKAALWAGAKDERFAMVVSNNSGCGGAAISRRRFGETIRIINDAFPHWFAKKFTRYNDREEQLPFDQHQLLALTAPRPLYVASASNDLWADPRGEFLSCVYASPVYGLYGLNGLTGVSMPAINTPVRGEAMAYHIREGEHNITAADWEHYLDFAAESLQTDD